ncbi:DUF4748 domain-containing protein [Hoplias malabaricus]|uniref:DUF4748 domain-containing protein n=1 Tax=Hoplias malabaricus TaxID=27720 RepID=UPI003461D8AF
MRLRCGTGKMAAACRTVLRSATTGLCYLSARRLCLRTHLVQNISSLRSQQFVLHSRTLHCSSLQGSNKTEPQKTEVPKSTETVKSSHEQKQTEDEVKEEYGPEYIPKKKAKNPMMIIGYAWIIGLPTGIIGFLMAKKQVDKNRLKQLKIRQRMKESNEGIYESERYKAARIE